MEVSSLQTLVAEKFYEIQRNFKCASAKTNIKYDYDVFCDTFLKCCEALNGKILSEKNIIKYFWVAFANNLKRKYYKSKYVPYFTEMDENVKVNEDEKSWKKYEVFDVIKHSVINKFGEDNFKLWYLHFIENKSYLELNKSGYTDVNFHNLFRRITNYVKYKLPIENKEYQTLLKEALNQ